jgi:predicted ATP-grasp superfamily ATP-dependent carboligase
VLVSDGEQRASLAVVRSLGRAGHRVLVASSGGRSLAGSSRYAAIEIALGDPLQDAPCFADAVGQAVTAHGVDVLLPMTDAALFALLPRRASLLPCRIPFPDLLQVERVADKGRVAVAAAACGIAVPVQRPFPSRGDLTPAERGSLVYPAVIKTSRSVTEGAGRREKHPVRYVRQPDELDRTLDAFPSHAYPLLFQQRIVGSGVGIFLLVWSGEIFACFAHRRLREKPPAGGVSVYRESIPADPALVARSRRLLDELEWQGVAMLEYKIDSATGTPYLLEINGRFWGSLQLAVDAGVDFPALLVALALGERPIPVTRYRTGIRSRWWFGDLDHLLARLRRSPEQLALPPNSPGRMAAVREFLALWRPGDRSEILRWSDPVPALTEALTWLRRR